MKCEQTNNYRLLLTKVVNTEQTYDFFWYSGLKKFRKRLLKEFPQMAKYFPKEMLNYGAYWSDRVRLRIGNYETNTGGTFLAANLTTPTTVIGPSINTDSLLEELEKGLKEEFPYTHVGFSLFIFGYSTFIECTQLVKKFDNNIITIAGNVGILEEGTENYVDHICRGDGVPFLRKLLGESLDRPYKSPLIPTKNYTKVFGRTIIDSTVQFITKLGCPMKCNFCSTNAYFQGKFMPSFITPKELFDMFVQYRNKIGRDFTTLFCEPTMIVKKDWWYEAFELFEGAEGDFAIGGPTTLASLATFDFRKTYDSSLRFLAFNVGIESFTVNYAKNLGHTKTKEIIQKLNDNGIATYGTFIIGFLEHNLENIWKEIEKLTDLDLTYCYINNLKPLSKTLVFNEMKEQKRLVDMPVDFHYIPGFQSFRHPEFRPGFIDMLPLIFEVNRHFEVECGHLPLNFIRLYGNLERLKPHLTEIFTKRRIQMQMISKALFPSWKRHLNPTQEQIDKYKGKLGDVPPIPFGLKLAVKSRLVQNLVSLFSKQER